MKKIKIRELLPYIVLLIVLIVIVFLLGVKHGKGVELINQKIQCLSMIKPTPIPPTPTIVPTINYQTYKNDQCKAYFIYPSNLELEEESSKSAKLNQKQAEIISLSCEKNNSIKDEYENITDKEATTSAKLLKATGKMLNQDKEVFYIYETNNFFIKIKKEYYPLINKSLETTK